MKKRWIWIVAAALAAAVLLTVGVTTAYFTDVEVKDNNITIGKVSIALDEGGFDPTTPVDVVPGSRVVKAPKLTNNGNKDEFVFIRLSVPKADVTLLYEADGDGQTRGTPKTGLDGKLQLFHIFADDSSAVQAVPAASGKDIDLSYHASGTTSHGWTLLGTESKTDFDEYVFGYNKLMKPEDETVTLFDTVTLKSFIDNQKTGEVTIDLKCYGIQSDYIKPSGAVDPEAEYLDDATLQAIYTIVRNKAGQ